MSKQRYSYKFKVEAVKQVTEPGRPAPRWPGTFAQPPVGDHDSRITQ